LEELASSYESELKAVCKVAARAELRRLAVDRTAVDESDLRARLDHWAEVLSGAPPELVLPFRTGVDAGATRGCSHRRLLGVQMSTRLIETARAQGVTPATVVLAAVTAVLSAWSGQATVVVGVPAARRYSPDEHRLVGFLVDTLPVRVDLRAARLSSACSTTCTNGTSTPSTTRSPSSTRSSTGWRWTRKPGVNPVFQVWFNDLSQAAPPPEVRGLRVAHLDIPTGHALFDVKLLPATRPGRVRAGTGPARGPHERRGG